MKKILIVESNKEPKMRIATHNGVFHADDVFAIAALRRLHPNAEVVRTRDLSIAADIRVDVGSKSAPETGDFDHHQRDGAGARPNGIPYAAFGLVWRCYGSEITGSEEVSANVDAQMVQFVDASDCGFAYRESTVDGVPLYGISHAIAALNPSWQEEIQDFDSAFGHAVKIAAVILEREIIRAQGEIEARDRVRAAIAEADREGRKYIILNTFCPWQEVAVTESEAVFCVFPSPTSDWRIQAIPPKLKSFDKRLPLPESWAGKSGEELVKLTGVGDAIFCHPGCFIAGAASKEGVLALAEAAIKIIEKIP